LWLVGVSAPVGDDGTTTVRPSARGQCPGLVPILVTDRRSSLAGHRKPVYARSMARINGFV